MKRSGPANRLVASIPGRRPHSLLAGALILSLSALAAQDETEEPQTTDSDADPIVIEDADTATGRGQLDTTTVVATKTPKALFELSPSVDTITGAELKARQLYSLEDVLSFSAGTSVVQTGQAGAQTSLFIRGMESNHTVVLLNGRRLAPGLAGLYNLELLDTTFLDSVALNRGPVSSLYGSDALAGALDLRMIDARHLEAPGTFTQFIEAGSFDSIRGGAQVTGTNGPVGVVVDLSAQQTGNDRPVNDFENFTLRANVSVEVGDRAWFDVLGFFQDSQLEVPGSSLSAFFPETQLNDNESGLLSPRFTVERDEWDFSVFYSYNTSELEATQDVFFLDNELDQYSHEAEAQLNLRPIEETEFTIGSGYYQYEFSRMPLIPGPFNLPSQKEYGYWSLFGQADIDLPANFNLLVSGRYDGHDSFESKGTYSAQLSQFFEPTRTQFFGKIATGYKAPSGQDFVFLDPSVNPDLLSPEESQSWEAGIRQLLPGDSGSLAFTYFQNDVDNLVDSFGFPAFPAEVDTEMEGIEVELVLRICDCLDVFANYTWLDATITDGLYFGGFAGGPGDRLPRRPEHTAAGGFRFYTDRLNFGAEIRGAADRLDSPGVELEDYAVARFFGSIAVTENIEIFGRVENAFNERFETTRGYEVARTAAYGGVRITF